MQLLTRVVFVRMRVLAREIVVDEEFAHGACQSRPGVGTLISTPGAVYGTLVPYAYCISSVI